MRHFKFYSDSALELSIAESLIKQKGVKHTFEWDDKRTNMGFKIGEYDIYVDEEKYSNEEVFKILEKYEYIEISKETYKRLLDVKAERSYNELCQKYKVIEEERDKYTKQKLAEQRHAILQDVLKEYEEDINTKINAGIYQKYSELKKRFYKDECTYSELSNLYKKYIDAELKLNLENFVKKYFTNKNVGYDIIDKHFNEFQCIYGRDEVYRDIKKFKNDLVDAFMKASGRERGHKDYWHYMKLAGKLADLIEGKLWCYYDMSNRPTHSEIL